MAEDTTMSYIPVFVSLSSIETMSSVVVVPSILFEVRSTVSVTHVNFRIIVATGTCCEWETPENVESGC